MNKQKLETEEEEKFVDLAFDLGCKAIKFIDPGSRNGPDRMVLCPKGRTIWFEFKRKDEEPRSGQYKYHDGLRSLGFLVYVVVEATQAEWILKRFLNEDSIS